MRTRTYRPSNSCQEGIVSLMPSHVLIVDHPYTFLHPGKKAVSHRSSCPCRHFESNCDIIPLNDREECHLDNPALQSPDGNEHQRHRHSYRNKRIGNNELQHRGIQPVSLEMDKRL